MPAMRLSRPSRTLLALSALALAAQASDNPPRLANTAMPAWRQAVAANTWTTVPSTNLLTDVDPAKNPALNPHFPAEPPWRASGGQSMMIRAWCGAVHDVTTDTFWIPIGGGHNDYAGNEPYRVRLDLDAPAWQLVRAPSGSLTHPADLTPDNTNTYSDGRPRSTHTYNHLIHVPGRGIFNTGHSSPYQIGFAYPGQKSWLMDESSGEWTAGGAASISSINAGTCHDPVRDRIWCQPSGDSALHSYDFTTQTWTPRGGDHGYAGANALTYLPGHDLIALNASFGGVTGPRFKIFNPATNLWTTPPLQGAPPAALRWTGQAQSRWVPSLGALCFWNNDTDTTVITTLTPTGNLRTDPWQWGTLAVAPANTVTPTARQENGTFGRFAYSPRLDGFFLLNANNQPFYFYALSAGAPPTTFAAWQAQQTWGGADSSETADPDGDSLSNLTEYALGLPPLTASTTGLPVATTTGGNLTLTYTLDITKTDIVYLPEASPDLINWSTAPTSLISQAAHLQTWTASIPVTPERQFLRLRITR